MCVDNLLTFLNVHFTVSVCVFLCMHVSAWSAMFVYLKRATLQITLNWAAADIHFSVVCIVFNWHWPRVVHISERCSFLAMLLLLFYWWFYDLEHPTNVNLSWNHTHAHVYVCIRNQPNAFQIGQYDRTVIRLFIAKR